MKRIILLLISTFFIFTSFSKENTPVALLTGASFATSVNGWFEMGCKSLNIKGINRAIGGESISNTANRMIEGTLYSKEEFEDLDIFIIMQVHDKDVFDESQLKENYTDYNIPFDKSNYAAAYDYVIKRYISECYNLKDNPSSKYYNSKSGKPVNIILCTHWHDSRTAFNSSIRKLANKWGFPLIEFDKHIGFSKDQIHPVTKQQFSLNYSQDLQKQKDGVFGWHPQRGNDSYIQKRMAAIFSQTMRYYLLDTQD